MADSAAERQARISLIVARMERKDSASTTIFNKAPSPSFLISAINVVVSSGEIAPSNASASLSAPLQTTSIFHLMNLWKSSSHILSSVVKLDKAQPSPHIMALDGGGVDQSNSPESESLLVGLPEVIEDNTLFTSSGASIPLPSNQKRHPMVFWLSALLVATAFLGFVNGADYIDGDSGIINHRNFIYRDAERAAPGTAVLLGQVVYENGESAPNHTVKVTVRSDDGSIFEKQNTTDENGNFRIDELDPGLQILIMANDSRGTAQLAEYEILLSAPPPFAFEPYGFTTLKLVFPSNEEFNNSADGTFISYVASQAENNTQLYDESAAGMYVMVGVGFSGLAIIALVATWLGWRDQSSGMLRTAAIFAFFSQGPYSSACCFGLLAFALTFALPRTRID